jgi:hypothetical protein
VDEVVPDVEKIIPTVDNLNAHSTASPYETVLLDEEKWMKDKLETHYTPKHGSQFNMAEMELNVINNRRLSLLMSALERMRKETAAWKRRCNKETCKVNRRFTTADPRINLKRLQPHFE